MRDRSLPCTGRTALFFPDPALLPTTRQEMTREAKQVCTLCPGDTMAACLDYAQRHRIKEGVWGGLSEQERKALRRKAG